MRKRSVFLCLLLVWTAVDARNEVALGDSAESFLQKSTIFLSPSFQNTRNSFEFQILNVRNTTNKSPDFGTSFVFFNVILITTRQRTFLASNDTDLVIAQQIFHLLKDRNVTINQITKLQPDHSDDPFISLRLSIQTEDFSHGNDSSNIKGIITNHLSQQLTTQLQSALAFGPQRLQNAEIIESSVEVVFGGLQADESNEENESAILSTRVMTGILVILAFAIICVVAVVAVLSKKLRSKAKFDDDPVRVLRKITLLRLQQGSGKGEESIKNSITHSLNQETRSTVLPSQFVSRGIQLSKRQVFSTITIEAKDSSKVNASTPYSSIDNFKAGNSVENKDKNRYCDIVPYDRTRVYLRPHLLKPGSDYINANYVPGYCNELEYICTQGPLPTTIEDFWRMVWEQRSNVIVVLTDIVENGRAKCEKYWPNIEQTFDIGPIRIECIEEQMLDEALWKRKFEIHNINTHSKRAIFQMQYTGWHEHLIPDCVSGVLNLRQEVNKMRKFLSGPVIVHCSAGFGRTGVYVLIDTEINRFDNERRIQLGETLCNMRRARPHLVQTDSQFVFAVKAILQATHKQEEVGPMGCDIQIRSYLMSFRTSEIFPDFELCDNGRRVIALGTAHLVNQDEGRLRVHLVLCNDVLVLTTMIQEQTSILVVPPIPRPEIYCDTMSGVWEEEYLRVLTRNQNILLLFASAIEKEYWRDLLSTFDGLVETEELAGPRMIVASPRQMHEFAAILGVPNPFTTYGVPELESIFKSVPKEILIDQQVDHSLRLALVHAQHQLDERDDVENAEVPGPSLSDIHNKGKEKAIGMLAHEVYQEERTNETAEDMLEIEYLMTAMEIQQSEEDVRRLIAKARTDQVAAFLEQQRIRIETELKHERHQAQIKSSFTAALSEPNKIVQGATAVGGNHQDFKYSHEDDEQKTKAKQECYDRVDLMVNNSVNIHHSDKSKVQNVVDEEDDYDDDGDDDGYMEIDPTPASRMANIDNISRDLFSNTSEVSSHNNCNQRSITTSAPQGQQIYDVDTHDPQSEVLLQQQFRQLMPGVDYDFEEQVITDNDRKYQNHCKGQIKLGWQQDQPTTSEDSQVMKLPAPKMIDAQGQLILNPEKSDTEQLALQESNTTDQLNGEPCPNLIDDQRSQQGNALDKSEGHRKKKIRVRTTIAGFVISKAAAKRLAKNQYEREQALLRQHAQKQQQEPHQSSREHANSYQDEQLGMETEYAPSPSLFYQSRISRCKEIDERSERTEYYTDNDVSTSDLWDADVADDHSN